MQNKIIITNNPFNNTQILSFIQEEGRIAQILTEEQSSSQIKVSQIYLGKIQSVVKNINAAFVEVTKGVLCFLPLEELSFSPKQGDEIPVQITREAIGSKQPVCSVNLSISGEYVVCRKKNKRGFFFSKKISNETKQQIKNSITNSLDCPYSYVIRTNAGELADYNILSEEINFLTLEMNSIIQKSETRTCFSLLKDCIPNYVSYIKEYCHNSGNDLLEVITDISDVAETLQANLSEKEQESVNITHYTDTFSLTNLYSLKTVLSDALSSKVWLKSGAFLVIESTEALVSIDVNTGKNIGNKSKEETILKVNLEAAKEIAFQLRLRNLSGIIIVDFINMESAGHQKTLLSEFRNFVAFDKTLTNVIDITKLGLIELTRKKIGKPLYQSINIRDLKQ